MPNTTYLRDIDPVLPVFFLCALVNFVAQKGHSPQTLLHGSGLDMAKLHDPETRVNFRAVSRVISQCEGVWTEGDLGVCFGQSLNLLSLGMIGQAAMASSTLGQAINTISHYLVLRDPLLQLDMTADNDGNTYTLHATLELQSTERFVVNAVLSATLQIIGELTQGAGSGLRFTVRQCFSADSQPHWPSVSVEFGAQSNSFSVPTALLSAPLATANPIVAEEARRYCDERFTQLQGHVGVVLAVRSYLVANLSSSPSETQTANALGYSARNLRRRLADEQLSYRQLKEGVVRQAAISMLRSGNKRVEDIAFELGYGTAGNFCRAFKRWTGLSPSSFRRND